MHPDDTLRAVDEVIEIRPSASKPDRGLVRLKCTTLNQRNEIVQSVISNPLIRRRRQA